MRYKSSITQDCPSQGPGNQLSEMTCSRTTGPVSQSLCEDRNLISLSAPTNKHGLITVTNPSLRPFRTCAPTHHLKTIPLSGPMNGVQYLPAYCNSLISLLQPSWVKSSLPAHLCRCSFSLTSEENLDIMKFQERIRGGHTTALESH